MVKHTITQDWVTIGKKKETFKRILSPKISIPTEQPGMDAASDIDEVIFICQNCGEKCNSGPVPFPFPGSGTKKQSQISTVETFIS